MWENYRDYINETINVVHDHLTYEMNEKKRKEKDKRGNEKETKRNKKKQIYK